MRTKRVVLGMILLLSLAILLGTAAYAADAPTRGSITITAAMETDRGWEGSVGVEAYHLYRIFDATIGFDENGNATDAISYTCTDAQKTIEGFDTYFTTSGTSVTGVTDAAKSSDGGLSPAAVQWIKEHITELGTLIQPYSEYEWRRYHSSDPTLPYYSTQYNYDNTPSTCTFHNLPFGYYFLDSAVGSAVMINSTQPNAEIYNKNETPTLEKKITKITNSNNEDASSNIYHETQPEYAQQDARSALAQIGDTVEYTITVRAMPAAERYILADSMDRSLTFLPDSVSVQVGGAELSSENYTIFKDSGLGFQYDGNTTSIKKIESGEAVYKFTDMNLYSTYDSIYLPSSSYYDQATGQSYQIGAQFVIIFKQAYLDTITEATDIVVKYQATVNEYAANVGPYQTIDHNAATLNYGHTYSLYDYCSISTLQLVVYKYEGSGASSSSSSKGLNGVGFVLTREDGKYFHQDPSTLAVTWVDNIEDATKLVTGKQTLPIWVYPSTPYGYGQWGQTEKDGYIIVDGLTRGTYTLIETDPLPGFNSAPDVTFSLPGSYSGWKTQLNIVNKTGTVLPSTGGIGVTVYYVIGVSMLLGGAILVLRKKAVKER